jgi:pimeloyl-ACP methyl ester carboxylesterase
LATKDTTQLLVLWGKHDLSFDLVEPDRYRKDVPNAEVHVLDAGHFALDTRADEVAALVRRFMAKAVLSNHREAVLSGTAGRQL